MVAELLHSYLTVYLALQVHGSAAIAELLGLPVPKRGRKSEVRSQKSDISLRDTIGVIQSPTASHN